MDIDRFDFYLDVKTSNHTKYKRISTVRVIQGAVGKRSSGRRRERTSWYAHAMTRITKPTGRLLFGPQTYICSQILCPNGTDILVSILCHAASHITCWFGMPDAQTLNSPSLNACFICAAEDGLVTTWGISWRVDKLTNWQFTIIPRGGVENTKLLAPNIKYDRKHWVIESSTS